MVVLVMMVRVIVVMPMIVIVMMGAGIVAIVVGQEVRIDLRDAI